MGELTCENCGTPLEYMAGCSAHHSNWYCPYCELTRERDTLKAELERVRDISRQHCEQIDRLQATIRKYQAGTTEALQQQEVSDET